ncbi:MAG TPA: hypothetical protein VHE99_12880 [Gammaproteobacteria bacterium]|nr:hypothetical protein [Gammaproteobacteria bacterium]
MRFSLKIITLLFSGVLLLVPSVSQAQYDIGPPMGGGGIDWDLFGLYTEAYQALGISFSELPNMTEEEKRNTIDQYLAKNEQLFEQYMTELYGYVEILNGIQNSTDAVDYDEIAQQLGLEPGVYTPDEILQRLNKIKDQYYLVRQGQESANASGITTGQYMRWLMGYVARDGVYCNSYPHASYGDPYNPSPEDFYSTDKVSCLSDLRNLPDTILHAPPANPNPPTPPTPPEQLESDTSDVGKGLLNNLRMQIPSLVRLVFAMSYTIGVVFCIIGMMKLKHIGENRGASMSHTGGLVGVMAYMITGTALIYLPSSLHMTTGTFFALGGDSSAFAYSSEAAAGMSFDNLVAVVVDIVKLVGLIAFVRGWILLSKVGSQSSHGTMGKSLVHIVAGILAVNIVTTWEVVRATFDYAW